MTTTGIRIFDERTDDLKETFPAWYEEMKQRLEAEPLEKKYFCAGCGKEMTYNAENDTFETVGGCDCAERFKDRIPMFDEINEEGKPFFI